MVGQKSAASKRPRRRQIIPEMPPGTLVRAANAEPSRIVVRSFSKEEFQESPLETGSEVLRQRDPERCLWVDVTGLADTDAIAEIGRAFELHALSLEDVLDPAQRGKVEEYDGYTFVVLKTLSVDGPLEASQLSIFFGKGFVVTLQDREQVAVASVRERLRQGRGKLRARTADYLAYALIDTVVDMYFPVVEAFDDHLEHVEEAVLEARGADPIDLARNARHRLRAIRHTVWQMRDVLASLLREEMTLVSDDTRVHLRDSYDHVIQLQEMIESSREIAASLLEAYISRVSVRTNEVMKVLTVIATIFIPLTFITGVYGMNFNPKSSPLNMPELDWYFGYPVSLLIMLSVAVWSLVYFRKKGWFGSSAAPARSRNREKHRRH